jgi:hypothetical protein
MTPPPAWKHILTHDMLHRHYVDEGMTTYAIANKVGCPDQTVATALAPAQHRPAPPTVANDRRHTGSHWLGVDQRVHVWAARYASRCPTPGEPASPQDVMHTWDHHSYGVPANT